MHFNIVWGFHISDTLFPTPKLTVTLSAYPQSFDFSCNTALQSLEVLLHPIVSPLQKYTRTIKELLSTIISPAFSEIVVVFSERQVYDPSDSLTQVLHEIYEIKKFRLAFCLEALEELRAPSLHHLTLRTRAAAAAGTYDFLPCPPSVFSRMVTKYDRFKSSVRDMYE